MTNRSYVRPAVPPPASGRPAPQGPSRSNGAGVPSQSADLAGPPWAGGTHIPSFALYGEAASLGQELLHIEEVQSRSRLYHWEIQPHTHQGLYQVLWLWRGQAEVLLDEHRSAAQAPAAIVLPPNVVHGFRFAPETDGRVLTLSARWLLEGETGALGAAFQELFAAPRLLHFWAEEAVAQRLDALFRELTHEFQWPTGAGGSPVLGWLARALVWRLAQASAQQRQAAPAGTPAPSAFHAIFVAAGAAFSGALAAAALRGAAGAVAAALEPPDAQRQWPQRPRAGARTADPRGLSAPALHRRTRCQLGARARFRRSCVFLALLQAPHRPEPATVSAGAAASAADRWPLR